MKWTKIAILLGAVLVLTLGLVAGVALRNDNDDAEATTGSGPSIAIYGAMVSIIAATSAARRRARRGDPDEA